MVSNTKEIFEILGNYMYLKLKRLTFHIPLQNPAVILKSSMAISLRAPFPRVARIITYMYERK